MLQYLHNCYVLLIIHCVNCDRNVSEVLFVCSEWSVRLCCVNCSIDVL